MNLIFYNRPDIIIEEPVIYKHRGHNKLLLTSRSYYGFVRQSPLHLELQGVYSPHPARLSRCHFSPSSFALFFSHQILFPTILSTLSNPVTRPLYVLSQMIHALLQMFHAPTHSASGQVFIKATCITRCCTLSSTRQYQRLFQNKRAFQAFEANEAHVKASGPSFRLNAKASAPTQEVQAHINRIKQAAKRRRVAFKERLLQAEVYIINHPTPSPPLQTALLPHCAFFEFEECRNQICTECTANNYWFVAPTFLLYITCKRAYIWNKCLISL